MTVKHIGADGRVRRTFENVSNIRTHEGSSVVVLSTVAIDALAKADIFTNWYVDYTVALIHLAEGESIEKLERETDVYRC